MPDKTKTTAVQLTHGARAFAHADGVFLGGTSNKGRELLAHEVTHVVQQGNGGSVTLRLKGMKPDAATKAEMQAATGKTVRLEFGGAKGATSAIEGRMVSTEPGEASAHAEWSVVFESIQRVR